jgi:hypothetical protein
MLASKVTRETLEAAAAEVCVCLDLDRKNDAGTRWRVKVLPLVPESAYTPGGRRRKGEKGNAPYQRTSFSYFRRGGRVHAVCWHGFRDFFRAVYRREPDAVFKTAIATYQGSADFEDRYPETGHRNVGPPIAPLAMAEACECPESGYAR